MMKLYYYDHCPFCIRTLMVVNYKQILVEKIILQYDEADLCIKLVGTKQVPILEFDDGTAMAESLDIVEKMDEIGNKDKFLAPKTNVEKTINEQIEIVRKSINALLFPRNIRVNLPEFATHEAIQYFKKKKEQQMGITFNEALEDTNLHKNSVEQMLLSLPPLPNSLNTSLSWDDIMIYPTLRNLTVVKDLKIPVTIKNYIDNISKIANIKTYYDIAL